MKNVLEIKNLEYKNILKEINFSLEENSFNILIGTNGSGKTTIVNCIRNLIKYKGEIKIYDEIVNKKNKEIYKQIGFFVQEQILLEDNLYEELLNMLKNLNYEEETAKKRIYSIVKKFDALQLLFKKESELSINEKVLISFIFAIIHEPKMLIVDNVLEKIELKIKNKIIDYLKKQKKQTILLISNDSEYFYIADKLLFLNEGKIILSGKLEEVIDKEKIFIKCGSKLPFMVDLSNKLISYELLNNIELQIEEMVNKIWN